MDVDRTSAIEPVERPTNTAAGRPGLLDRVRQIARVRHLAASTERAYVHWVRRYVAFHDRRHPRDLAEADVAAFLTHLAVREHVATSTQNQALAALLFLYGHVIGRPLERLDGVARARRPTRLPTVLTPDEVERVLALLVGDRRVVATLLYGAGLRLLEALRLRVKDIDMERGELMIREAKGNKDRVTVLPDCLRGSLGEILHRGRRLHAAEVDYLVAEEWARTAEDVLYRRSKLGLHMPPEEIGRAHV